VVIHLLVSDFSSLYIRQEDGSGTTGTVMAAKFILFFLIIFLSIAVNMPDSMIVRMGFDANYLFAALGAVAITGLIVHRRILLVVLVIVSTIGANLPVSIADQLGLDRDILVATLVALVVIPYVAGKVEMK